MPPYLYIFSGSDSGVEMDPGKLASYPRFGSRKRADWFGGRLAVTSRDHPGIAEHFASIKWDAYLESNPSKEFPRFHFGIFLANVAVARKWLQEYWIRSRV